MAQIEIGGFIVGGIGTNVYYLHEEGSKDAILVDPADSGAEVYEALLAKGLTVRYILLTHGHFDHIWGVAGVVERAAQDDVDVEIYACEKERDFLLNPEDNQSAGYNRPCTVTADHYLRDGEEVTLLGMKIRCIWTPGHTEGSCCYYIEGNTEPILLAGDTLFCESVGRTDFPTGSMGDLVRSIKEKLFVLPDETVVYPGHMQTTTIAHEKAFNYMVG